MRHSALLSIVFGLAALHAPSAFAKDYLVRAVSRPDGSFAFEPSTLRIKSGDTVAWVNAQDDSHNVMAESVPEGAENFESPMFEKKGDRWTYAFKTSGTYVYHCHPHAENGMRGTIIVDHPSTPVPVADHGEHSHHGESSAHKH